MKNLRLVLAVLLMTGCGGPTTLQPAAGPGVRFTCEGSPVANLLVRLHASPEGPCLGQGITADDGVVRFSELPQPLPERWYVALESVGDGGWMLDARYATPSANGLTLERLEEEQPATLELPAKAIRSLSR
jgi:hypothetical protein